MVIELFHRIDDGASGRLRKRIVELGLKERFDFRNVHFESHLAELSSHGSPQVPAIWDGTTLHSGEAACFEFVEALRASARVQ